MAALAGRSWPRDFPRADSSRWRRPLEGAGPRRPCPEPRALGPEPSRGKQRGLEGSGALSEDCRREAGEEEGGGGTSPRDGELYRVEKFLRGRLPLACRAVPCVRRCWKAGSSHIPRRFSRHLTRRGGDGGGGRGRGAGRHHPPQRTHSRARRASEVGPPPEGQIWARALEVGTLPSKGKPEAGGIRASAGLGLAAPVPTGLVQSIV